MNKMKKLLAVLMLVCMLVSLMPTGAAFADGYTNTPGDGHTCQYDTANPTGLCTLCGGQCPHAHHDQTTKVCPACGMTVDHSWSAGVCSKCSLAHTHAPADWSALDGVCATCGFSCTHSFGTAASDGSKTCETCGYVCGGTSHGHTYNTTDQSKTATYRTGVCTTCGSTHAVHSYNSSDAANTATYRTGFCSVCGFEHTPHAYNTTDAANTATYNTGYCKDCGKAHAHAAADFTAVASTETKACGTCGFVCGGADPNGHDWHNNDGVCARCGYACTHASHTQAGCPTCGKLSAHTWTEDAATKTRTCSVATCGLVCDPSTHVWTNNDGVCAICGYECTHTYNTTDNTKPEYKTGVCTTCGKTCAHSYSAGVCTICQKVQPVATIGATEYTSLALAFAAAQNGDTITLCATVSESPAAPLSLADGVAAVLDMRGFNVTLLGGSGYIASATGLNITNSGSGTAVITSTGAVPGVVVVSGGSLTVSANVSLIGESTIGLKITGAAVGNVNVSGSASGTNGIVVASGAAIAEGSALTVSGAVSGEGYAIDLLGGGSCVMSGGSVTGSSAGVRVKSGSLQVDGGSITGSAGPAILIDQAADLGNVTINAGAGAISGTPNSVKHKSNSLASASIFVYGGSFTGTLYSDNGSIIVFNAVQIPAVSVASGATVDAGYLMSGTANTIKVTGSAKTVTLGLPNAGLDRAKNASGSLTVETGVGTVRFNSAALTTMAAAGSDLTFTLADNTPAGAAAGTKSFSLSLSNNVGSTGFGGGSVTVALKVGSTAPKELVHTKSDGTKEYFYATAGESTAGKTFSYDSAAGTATIVIDSFSGITASTATTGAPSITTAGLNDGVVGTAYELTLQATGTNTTADPMTWAITAGSLPAGLSFDTATGKISGTPTAATVSPVDLTFQATNSLGVNTKAMTLNIRASANYAVTTAAGVISYYDSFAAAQTAASAGDTITALKADATDITITKNITFDGGNTNFTGDITVGSAATGAVTIQNVKNSAATLTAQTGSKPIVKGCTFSSVTAATGSELTVDGCTLSSATAQPSSTLNLKNSRATTVNASAGSTANLSGTNVVSTVHCFPSVGSEGDARVNISGGDYTNLYGSGDNATTGTVGDYFITGGTFASTVPLAWCGRTVNADTSVTQYIPIVSGSKFAVIKLVPKIEKCSNSSYYYRRSTTGTLTFSTNIPYALYNATLANSDIKKITVPESSTTLNLLERSSYLTASKNADTGCVDFTLTNSYLYGRSAAKYTFQMETLEGNATWEFEVGTTVKTGDSSNLALWMWIMGGSVLVLCGAVAYIVLKNKKKK